MSLALLVVWPDRDTQKLREIEKISGELQRAKVQCDFVKNLLADATAEKDIMYDVRSIAFRARLAGSDPH